MRAIGEGAAVSVWIPAVAMPLATGDSRPGHKFYDFTFSENTIIATVEENWRIAGYLAIYFYALIDTDRNRSGRNDKHETINH